MSLVRSCYATLNCSALCKPSASFISSCITLGLLKTAHPPKTRATSANGFMCWIDRLLLSPTGGMVTLLMFIQFAALLNRELGAGVWLSAACLLQKIRSPSRSRPQLARRNRRPHQTHLLIICATLSLAGLGSRILAQRRIPQTSAHQHPQSLGHIRAHRQAQARFIARF